MKHVPAGTKFILPNGDKCIATYSARCIPRLELALAFVEVFEAGKIAGKKELLSYYKERSYVGRPQ
jgi:hypothetical protein